MNISFQQAAGDDLARQFRYYLVTLNAPGVAVRFRKSVRLSVEALRRHPLAGPLYPLSNRELQGVRSWPVEGFEVMRVYYQLDGDTIRVIRILHGKRDVKRILEAERQVGE